MFGFPRGRECCTVRMYSILHKDSFVSSVLLGTGTYGSTMIVWFITGGYYCLYFYYHKL